MIWLALLGCVPEPDPVAITGRIRRGPYGGEGPVTAGEVTIYDDAVDLYDAGPIASDGTFAVTGPKGGILLAEVSGPGLVPASFRGQVGQSPLEVVDGELFGWTEEAQAELLASFGDCVVPGPVIFGEIRIVQLFDENTGEHPLVSRGFAELRPADGSDPIPACYLDEQGAYQPGLTFTGDVGLFAIFGAPGGVHPLRYGYDLAPDLDDDEILTQLEVYVPETGVVPLFPAWVDYFF